MKSKAAVRRIVEELKVLSDAAYRNLTKKVRNRNMNWIYSLVMNTVNSSLPTASSRMKLKYITPVWAVRYMEEEVSCPIFSYHRIQPV